MRKTIFVLGCVAIVAAIAYTLIAELAVGPTCDVAELDAHPSPDGKHISSVFRRDCGATTNFVTGVALRRSDQSFGVDDANTVLTADGVVPIVLRWTADDMLEIEASTAARIFEKNDRVSGVETRIVRANPD